MKTIKLNYDDYFDIEQIVKKIASENKIENVSEVNIKLFKEKLYDSLIKFAIIDPWADYDAEGNEIRYTQETEEEFEAESEENGSKHGPYEFRITYQTVTEESAEIGDYADQGWELQDGHADDMDDLIYELDRYGFYEDTGHGLNELRFNTVDPVRDRAYYEEGESKYYTVFINREDGQDFEQKEADEIKQKLGIR